MVGLYAHILRTDDPDDQSTDYVDLLYPTFFEPTIPVFDLPSDCPDSVRALINESWTLMWVNPSAAAARIRTALEKLMDEFKVPAANLHTRVEYFKKHNNLEVGEILLATKWLGNIGTHGTEFTHTDLMDVYEFIDHALEKLYDDRHDVLLQKAGLINEAKGKV